MKFKKKFSLSFLFSPWLFSFLFVYLFVSSYFFNFILETDSHFLSSLFTFNSSILFIINSFVPLCITLILFVFFLFFRRGISFLLFQTIRAKNLIPKLSSTEREALTAGQSWIETEFFTGSLDFKKIFFKDKPKLSEEENNFLNKEVAELCEISDEWELIQRRKLTEQTKDFLKKEGFFGLTIPKEYKGKGFSHLAHARVIEKIAGHNVPLSIIVMVPNSLGPAELILEHGTLEQKNKYLPRLALGEDIPCFGLTEPQAGSDAGSIQSEGVLFKEGDEIKIRLNWEKRWITLSSMATLIGLAVQLKDPDHLLSEKEHLGITCLLIPGNTPGIQRGFHHDPMGLPFYNAPIKGKDVIVLAEESIIGGLKNAGKGWKMIMSALSAGRAISLPSSSIGAGKRISLLAGSHALVRKQFGQSIGQFEGVQEALGNIAGWSHLMSAIQTFSLRALMKGISSPVVSAISKYQLTEIAFKVCKQGMDIMAGAGLSLGPKNKIASIYLSSPVSITVEGANILTRTFIIYGQGIIKSHPYIFPLIESLEKNSLKSFHKNLWAFFYHFLKNFIMGICFSLSRGILSSPATLFSKEHRYLQKLKWSSYLFAFLSELNLLVFGEKLKSKGRLSGRLADILSYQYMIASLIQDYRDNKNSPHSWIKNQWGIEYCFSEIQKSLLDLLRNYPHRGVRFLFKPLYWLLWLSPIGKAPKDYLGQELARKLLKEKSFRDELCSNRYASKNPKDQLYKLNIAWELSLKEDQILKKLKKAVGKKISYEKAFKEGLISSEDYNIIKEAKKAQLEAIKVDSFTEEEYFNRKI